MQIAIASIQFTGKSSIPIYIRGFGIDILPCLIEFLKIPVAMKVFLLTPFHKINLIWLTFFFSYVIIFFRFFEFTEV